jgi:hypothetical protein
MAFQYENYADAALLTLEKLIQRGAFVDLQVDLQDHVAVREMWKGRQKQFAGGDPWRFDIQTDHNHSTRAVGLYQADGSAFGDTMAKGVIHVRHVNSHYTYDLREKAFQKGGTEIVNLIKTKYVAMMISFYEWLEEICWSNPDNDGLTPFGIAHYVTRAAADAEGFNGVDPTGFPLGRSEILVAAQPRYNNYNAQYVAVSKEDLIRKMRRASRQTKFRSPVSHAEPVLGGMKNGIYVNNDVIGLMEEILEDQNMNLGNDMASKDGRAHFKGTPVVYAPYLDADAADPVYMLDWKWLAIGVLAGWENEMTKPYPVPDMHNVRRVDLDASMNMACTNLRRQTVISKAA